MITSNEYTSLFEAFRDARHAYERLYTKGLGRPDLELARDPDYRLFLHSGMKLAKLGGTEAIKGATRLLCQSPEGEGSEAQFEIERLWAGMGTWKN